MHKTQQAIKIDGKADEQCWQQSTLADKFYYLGSAKKAQPETKFKFAYDNKNFYFYIHCSEPEMSNLKATVKQRDGNVWEDDSVEIFLCPYGEFDSYSHYIINSIGTLWDAKITEGNADAGWNSQAKVAVAKGEDYWAVEGSIPMSDLVKKTKPTLTVWLGNVSRQRLTANKRNKYSKCT